MVILFVALAIVESDLNPRAVGDGGKAVGIVQIWPCVVEDVNEHLRRKGIDVRYTVEDRYDIQKSYQMFVWYMDRWADGKSLEEKARIWNGGPKGHLKAATKPYWDKVRKTLLRAKHIVRGYNHENVDSSDQERHAHHDHHDRSDVRESHHRGKIAAHAL